MSRKRIPLFRSTPLRRATLLGLLCLAMSSCAGINLQRENLKLTILHTNDHHGRFWPNQNGEYGMAARKTLIDRVRSEVEAEGGYVLLLSAGDINTGVPESDIAHAEPDFKAMRLMGYDAMSVGNHEFDNSLATIRLQENWAKFPFLSANTYAEDGNRLFEPYKVFEFGGRSVAVLGLLTADTATIGNQEYVKGIRFTQPEEETNALIAELRANADFIIALTHLGHHQSTVGSDVALARSVNGLGIIVGGHSSEPICVSSEGKLLLRYAPGSACMPDRIGDTWIVQAHEWGRYVGRADFTMSDEGAELNSYQLIPVNLKASGDWVGEYIAPDQEMEEFLSTYQASSGSELGKKLSYVSGYFDRSDYRRAPNPTTIGHLIAAAFADAANADIGITNRGGVRDNLYPGDLTTKHILQVAPFENTVVYCQFSGKKSLRYLNDTALLPRNRPKLEFSGMKFVNDQLVLNSTERPIDADGEYRVALNSFMAAGGDGMPDITAYSCYQNTGVVDSQALMDYVSKHDTLAPEDY